MGALPSVSVVGVGIMGTAISSRLLEVGHQVTVFDIDTARVRALVEKGATAAVNPGAAASASEFTITSLNSPAIVRKAVFGPQGIVEGAAADKMLIDMSAIDPDSTRAMAAELREKTGMAWVDCPLSGGAPKAVIGQLTIMAGGEAAEVEKARRVMNSLSANYTHMGPVGAGQTTKMVNQILCAITFQAVAEAVRFAEAGGVDAAKIPAALAGGRADSRILQEFGAKMAVRDYSPTGRIDNMLKDLDPAQRFAAANCLAMPLTSAVTDLHRLLVAAGIGPEDSAAMMKFFDGFRDR